MKLLDRFVELYPGKPLSYIRFERHSLSSVSRYMFASETILFNDAVDVTTNCVILPQNSIMSYVHETWEQGRVFYQIILNNSEKFIALPFRENEEDEAAMVKLKVKI